MTYVTRTVSPATDMIFRIFSSALIAGGLAGVLVGLLQLAFVQPVLLHAELYETGQLVHFGAVSDALAQQTVPVVDFRRDLLSVAFSALLFFGYAMLLLGAMLFAEERHDLSVSPRVGLLWGVAAFVVMNMAPAFSMAPEVPGVAAADVVHRQVWWFVTVVLAVIALWLIGLVRSPGAVAVAIVLLVAPHFAGAPEPAVFAGAAPPEIAAKFVARAIGVNFAGWSILGVLVSAVWNRSVAGAQMG